MKTRDFPGRGSQLNVLGGPLLTCSDQPKTGFFRDGCCNTSEEDLGSHTVCVVLTADFLEFSKSRGNDLSTPRPEFGLPSLRAAWHQMVDEAIAAATLKRPADVKRYVPEGKRGVHSEYLSYLLGEMQSLARAHPGATW